MDDLGFSASTPASAYRNDALWAFGFLSVALPVALGLVGLGYAAVSLGWGWVCGRVTGTERSGRCE